MILIFSDADDLSTDFVIDYLNVLNANYIRINFVDIIENLSSISFNLETTVLRIDKTTVDLSQVRAVWLRKIGFLKKSQYYKNYQNAFRDFPSKDILMEYLSKELYSFIKTIFKHISKNAYWITHHHSALNISKMETLTIAKKCGLTIPSSLITNNRKDIATNRNVISKSIGEFVFFTKKKSYYQMLTQRISDSDKIPDLFFPSLIQDNINKDFELRIFYMEERFYPMAIFSQNDKQTEVDFRNYNLKRSNRNVPYILPKQLTKKLYKFTRELNLNCGSIDMIKSKNGDYIFLEVNPNGQFGMVDTPCNYKLNKKIAEQLVGKSQY